jgi:FG-GAP-like repeat
MQRFFGKTILILLFCLLLPSGSAFATHGDQVIFYPTDVSEAGDLAYLHESVRLMLASRLASVAGIQPQFEEKGTGGTAKYRVQSRIVSAGKKVTVSASVQSPSNASSIAFQATAVESSQVMKALEELVDEMAQSLFDAKAKVVSATITPKAAAVTSFHTPHPDRQVKENSGFGLSITQDEFIAQMAVEVAATERYKSTVLHFRTQGMSAGDIDGDGLDEILVVTNVKIHIYQLREKRIHPLTTIALPALLKVHAVNIADLNNNGVMEIYVSATRKGDPKSFVLEWQPESGVTWLHKEVPKYLRPLRLPGKGLVLAGQSGGLEGGALAGIYQLSLQPGEQIATGELLPVPESVNLFEFVFADLEGDGVAEVVAINKKEELKVFDSNLELLYTSPAGFGGREMSEGLNVPIRLVVTDFDADGKDDILLVDNELSSPKMLKKSKYYENGQVRGLLWDRDLFLEMWRTNIFQKSIVDFQFLILPGTEKTSTSVAGRLFITEPAKANSLGGLLFDDGGTRLSVYGMEFTPKGR